MTSDPNVTTELNGVESREIGVMGGDRNSTATNPVPSPPIDPTPAKERKPMAATQERKTGPPRRPLSIVREGDGDPRHGRVSTYNNHDCRCPACTEAAREYARELRERRRQAREAG